MDSSAAIPGMMDLYSRTSTFVSIDVVNSTSLKSGENEQDVIYTFLSYHKLVRELAYTYHGEIMSISGDGVMCRFERATDAGMMAQTLLAEIPGFNKRQNRLSRPFAIRMGLNTGQVFEHQSMAQGQLISHTIDVAAKLQQGAGSNQARFSQETVNQLKEANLSLVKLAWDAKLQTTAYELGGIAAKQAAQRVLPDPVKILLLENQLSDIMRIRKVLFTKRYETLPIYSPEQASICLGAWQPHVMMVSSDLPAGTGWDFLKAVRADQKASRLPVIVLARHSTGETVERCFGLGANGFLQKPLEDQQILKRVDTVLREFYL